MRVVFRFQDVPKIMNDGLLTLEVNAIDAQKVTHREPSQKDGKCLL